MAGNPPEVIAAAVERVPVTAIVTAYERIDAALVTIERLVNCRPAPDEILVHVDGNAVSCEQAIKRSYPSLTVVVSRASVGPGGGRNLLLAMARHPIVASFDDDAFPIDLDFFARLMTLFASFPTASIVTARVFHVDETLEPATPGARWVADFSGGASAYRKQVFDGVGGYVPVPLAYGMEEVDLALRLHAAGGQVLETSWLRVFHDTDRKRHGQPEVTAATISNIAVLASLRYPVLLWPAAAWQVLSRVRWLLTHGRYRGIVRGVSRIPVEVIRYRAFRRRLPLDVVRAYWRLRRHPVAAGWPAGI